MSAIYIGTSGWHYKHWQGLFYPAALKPQDYLPYYLQFYNTVEINNSFYRLPSAETFAHWRQMVPANFVFSVKASRFITHLKKLKDPQTPVASFLHNASALAETLGPVLFQLPPRWHCNITRLQQFLEALPTGFKYTFEFRDTSWYHQAIYDVLRQHKAAFCIYHLDQHQSPVVVTADFVYIRLHGPDGKYHGQYADGVLQDWAAAAREWADAGKSVYIYFDNDIGGHAVTDARRLLAMVRPV